MIPSETIQEVNGRADLVSIIGQHVNLKKMNGGRYYMGRCPFHDDNTPSFIVRPHEGHYNCYGCGEFGDAIKFRMQYEGVSFIESVTTLAAETGVSIAENKEDFSPDRDVALILKKLNQAQSLYEQELLDSAEALSYVKERGVDADIAAMYRLGYAPGNGSLMRSLLFEYENDGEYLVRSGLVHDDGSERSGADRFVNRIMFPIRNMRGNTVGFSGRYIGPSDQAPKYLNSPETEAFKKSERLFGLHEALQLQRRPDRIYVVEGQMDVLAARAAGFHAVAAMGSSVSTQQLRTLFSHTDEIVTCMDGDQAGVKATDAMVSSVAEIMHADRVIRFVHLPVDHDPDTFIKAFGAEQLRQITDTAETFSQALSRLAIAQSDITTPEGRAQAADRFSSMMAKMEANALRDAIVQEFSQYIGAHYPQMMSQVSSKRKKLQDASEPPQTKLMGPEISRTSDQIRMDPTATLAYIVISFPTTADYINGILPEGAELMPRGDLLKALAHKGSETQDASVETLIAAVPESQREWLHYCAASQPFGSLDVHQDRREIKTLIDNAVTWLSNNMAAARSHMAQRDPAAQPQSTNRDHWDNRTTEPVTKTIEAAKAQPNPFD